MRKKITKEDLDFAKAVVACTEMEETADYVSRGRPLSSLSDEQAKRAWTVAFKSWAADRSHQKQSAMDDLSAELRLRNIELPSETVASELEMLSGEIRAKHERHGVPPELKDSMLDAIRKMRGPRN